jgi:hypothetical protein
LDTHARVFDLNHAFPTRAQRIAAKYRQAAGLGTIRQDISVTDSLFALNIPEPIDHDPR